MPRILAIAALALLAAPLPAQMPSSQPGKIAPDAVPAGTYKVDPNHTQVTWLVNHMNFSLLQGQFGASGGTLTIDPRRPTTARLEVTFDLNQLSTTSTHFTEHLKSKDYFETATYPTARFVSTAISWQGTAAVITGNLTIKNKTKPVTLQAMMIGAGINPMTKKLNFGFHATATIDRSDFGVGLAAPLVADNVDLSINAAFLAE